MNNYCRKFEMQNFSRSKDMDGSHNLNRSCDTSHVTFSGKLILSPVGLASTWRVYDCEILSNKQTRILYLSEMLTRACGSYTLKFTFFDSVALTQKFRNIWFDQKPC